MALVLDSGGVSRLSERSAAAGALISALRHEGLWPPRVPTPVLVECLTGDGTRDAMTHRLLRTCDVVDHISVTVARSAAALRARARRGSAVDALVVAIAQPGGTVLTGDTKDLGPLAQHAEDVHVQPV